MSSLFQPSLGTVIAVTPTLQMLQPLNRRQQQAQSDPFHPPLTDRTTGEGLRGAC
ncbi:hypothetical protein BJD73_gp35 [Mycobacterium phage Brocalys]|uniref:hypothetical protein n=1 Tax=Mycobacterium phage Brocalys TaxID=1815608 RepID=UPI00078C3DE8|nr:hypothetical protein BJD73_gp35 [Mycobacterium phage Brocalys]AMS01742.1 hypothetical protein SEA_BROCALYS_35 [Mycobacterium phage Brocalys]AXC35640.1 hypothetical protein SEA_CLIFTON_34 [Mycobacterium phage Clifton]